MSPEEPADAGPPDDANSDVFGAYGQLTGVWRYLPAVFLVVALACLAVAGARGNLRYLFYGLLMLGTSASSWVMRTPSVVINDEGIVIRSELTGRQQHVSWKSVSEVDQRDSWYGDRLFLRTTDGRRYLLRGLPWGRTFHDSFADLLEQKRLEG